MTGLVKKGLTRGAKSQALARPVIDPVNGELYCLVGTVFQIGGFGQGERDILIHPHYLYGALGADAANYGKGKHDD
ncbi:hypothetical protein FACS1894158_10300 [Betaproteobacteria bacterium]|nr:hypothetical protein FACS1894158_10300 [Betaproteobacteria bacterium]GHU19995.1 hypothetical protein FACS189475_08170 [Betaproteobacteria bacterium]